MSSSRGASSSSLVLRVQLPAQLPPKKRALEAGKNGTAEPEDKRARVDARAQTTRRVTWGTPMVVGTLEIPREMLLPPSDFFPMTEVYRCVAEVKRERMLASLTSA